MAVSKTDAILLRMLSSERFNTSVTVSCMESDVVDKLMASS